MMGSGEFQAKIDITGYRRIQRIDDRGAHNLIAAVVALAARDYRRSLKHKGVWMRRDCETFFLSDYFYEMTGLDGEAIMAGLRRGA